MAKLNYTSLLAYQTDILYRHAYGVLLVSLIVPVVIALVLWGEMSQTLLLTWAIGLIALTFLRLRMVRAYHQQSAPDPHTWSRYFVISSTLAGIVLGLSAFFFHMTDGLRFFFLFVIAIGMMGGAVSSLSIHLPSVTAYFLGLASPYIIFFAYELWHHPGNIIILGMGFLYVIYAVMLLRFARSLNHSLNENFLMFQEKSALSQELEVKQQKLLLSDIALRNVTEGILITDAENRIVFANKAFTDISGYQEHEVLGHTPALFRSERQDDQFYEKMWRTLDEHNIWQGEIWNRRKNGEIFPESLSISVIRNDKGEVVNHLAHFNDITERKREEEQLRYLANYDLLTGLPNRKFIYDHIDLLLSRVKEEGLTFTLMFLDLNLFKQVNDQHGHAIGDMLLKEVALRIKSVLRDEDSVARLGGDEFVVLIERLPPRDIDQVTGNLVNSLQTPFVINGIHCQIGVSIGIALAPEHGIERRQLMHHADTAMYQAKKSANDHWLVYQAVD